MRRFDRAPASGEPIEQLTGSICIGCGCTDDCACEGGCSWLAAYGGVGVCSTCGHALAAWDGGARLAGWLQEETPPGEVLLVQLGGRWVREYAPGTGQVPGTYYTVNEEAGTVRLVDEQGLPAIGGRDLLRVTYTTDWEAAARAKTAEAKRNGWLPREPSADQKRGQQLKTERGRARAKAAGKARQVQRRRL